MPLKRVVVTGLGALTPIGNNLNDFWTGLIQGKSGAAPITYFDAEKFKTRFACELKNFDVSLHLDRKQSSWIKEIVLCSNTTEDNISRRVIYFAGTLQETGTPYD